MWDKIDSYVYKCFRLHDKDVTNENMAIDTIENVQSKMDETYPQRTTFLFHHAQHKGVLQ